jgi:hypothetical protein
MALLAPGFDPVLKASPNKLKTANLNSSLDSSYNLSHLIPNAVYLHLYTGIDPDMPH